MECVCCATGHIPIDMYDVTRNASCSLQIALFTCQIFLIRKQSFECKLILQELTSELYNFRIVYWITEKIRSAEEIENFFLMWNIIRSNVNRALAGFTHKRQSFTASHV